MPPLPRIKAVYYSNPISLHMPKKSTFVPVAARICDIAVVRGREPAPPGFSKIAESYGHTANLNEVSSAASAPAVLPWLYMYLVWLLVWL